MVSNLVSNALESHAQVFPVLTEAQINRIRPFASLRHVNDGDVLFRADDSDAPFFVLLSGSMEIVQPDVNDERLVANHGPGEFTGEMTMITLDAVKQDGAWPLARSPYMLETSLPRVFAVRDVRSGNVKRVASAVVEGSIAINLVHRALAEY